MFEFATRDQPSIEHISAFRKKYRRSSSYRLVARVVYSSVLESNLNNRNRCLRNRFPIEWGGGEERD